MENKKLKYSILRIIVDTIFIILMLAIFWLFIDKMWSDEWLDDALLFITQGFLKVLLPIFIIEIIVILFSSIFHELGHLIFGLRAKLIFKSFNVKGLSIIRENNHYKINKEPSQKGLLGYCEMFFDDKYNYPKSKVILYFLGGIIFNLILMLMFIIVLIVSNNEYIRLLCMVFIIFNFYMGAYNSIPYITSFGNITDMRHIINYVNDPEYSKKFGVVSKIIRQYSKRNSIDDIDENLIFMPKSFTSDVDITIATIYIGYLSEKKDYNGVLKTIKYVQDNSKKTLSKSQINMLKIYEVDCIMNTKYDEERIKEIWSKEFGEFVNQMSIISISFLGFNYLYYSLVNIDRNKANEILEQFEKRKNKCKDKKEVEETEIIIRNVNKYIK